MNNFKTKMYRFLQRRYGNDLLNNALFVLALILLIVNAFFFRSTFLNFLIEAILILTIFRSFSSNHWARQKENQWFLNKTKRPRHWFSMKSKEKNDPSNKYFLCPHCAQILRVPRHRGQLEIHCPSCHHHFDAES